MAIEDVIPVDGWSPNNLEELILKELNRATLGQLIRVVGDTTAHCFISNTEGSELKSLEELRDYGDEVLVELIEWGHLKAYNRWADKEVRRAIQFERRITYLPEPVLFWNPITNKSGEHTHDTFYFESDLRCAGLLKHIVKVEAPDEEEPCAIQVLDLTKRGIPLKEWEKFESMHWRISQGSLIWNTKSLAWRYITTALPEVIDTNPYNRRLNSACEPGGVMMHVPVMITQLKGADGKPLGVDGSGLIDYEHPIFDQMGVNPCALQFTIINKDGFFLKGMLQVGEVKINAAPGIMCDWQQVKGRFRLNAKKYMQEQPDTKILINAHIGIRDANNKKRTIGWGFEQLENIKWNEETRRILFWHLEENCKKLVEEIPEEVARLKETSHTLGKLVRLFELQKDVGLQNPADPLRVPIIRDRIKDRLAKRFWKLATGAGIESPYLRVFMDNSVPPGHIVISDYRFKNVPIGAEVVVFRTPVVLSQGMSILRRVDPTPGHGGYLKQNPHCCWMNPLDLVDRMQGDDDGDDVGVDARPDIVTLARNILDKKVYLLETTGTRISTHVESPEGIKYLRGDPMGPVGELTMARTKHLCAGDIMGALACSALIQTAIDTQKKILVWPDYRLLVDKNQWQKIEVEHGGLKYERYKHDCWADKSLLDKEGVIDLFKFWEWSQNRLCVLKGVNKDKLPNWMSWRKLGEGKRLLPENIKKIPGESTLAQVWNRFVEHYHGLIEKETRFEKTPIEISKLLAVLLSQKNVPVKYRVYDWNVYNMKNGLREKTRIKNHNQKMGVIQSRDHSGKNADDQDSKILLARNMISSRVAILQDHIRKNVQEGHIELQDMLDIWAMECKCKEGSITNAINATIFEGSPINKLLEIEEHADCPSIQHKNLEMVTEHSMQFDNPFEGLTRVLTGIDTFEYEDGEKIRIHTCECEFCVQQHTKHLVTHLRNQKSIKEFAFMRKMIGLLKQ